MKEVVVVGFSIEVEEKKILESFTYLDSRNEKIVEQEKKEKVEE